MKKKSIENLHRLAVAILKQDESSDWGVLQKSAQQLYEQLSVQVYLDKQPVSKPKAAPTKNHTEDLAEPLMEKIKDIVAQMPSETTQVDRLMDNLDSSQKTTIDLDDFAQHYRETPVFERKGNAAPTENNEPKATTAPEIKASSQGKHNDASVNSAHRIGRQPSLNDRLNKELSIGLNDRLAFTKHLFNGNADDYNRVISQVTTLENYEEATDFLTRQVQPDYNWEGKEQHVERLLKLVEKRFQ